VKVELTAKKYFSIGFLTVAIMAFRWLVVKLLENANK
jgi:hypothetical protein